MSTLKVTNLQNENGIGPAMSINVGGGVTFAGITTFHSAIVSDGNIGIGTDNPTTPLHIVSPSTGFKVQRDNKTFTINANYASQNLCAFEFTDALGFFPGGSTEKVRITSGGSVGIGTDEPVSGKLHVLGGNIRISGTTENILKIRHETAGADSNISQTDDGSLRYRYGTDERFRITSDGNIGIGSTQPTAKLDVAGSARFANVTLKTSDGSTDPQVLAGTYDANYSYTGIYNKVGTLDATKPSLFIYDLTGTTYQFSVFQDGSANFAGQGTFGSINTSSTTTSGCIVPTDGGLFVQRIAAETGSNPVFRGYRGTSVTSSIACDGSATFAGNIAFADGQGIDFSSNSTAGSGTTTSSVLNDYEEGTFTATFGSVSGSVGTVNYDGSQEGTYTKIGNLVYIECRLAVTSYTGTGWNNALIGGLPFANDSVGTRLAQIVANDWANITLSGGRTNLGFYGRANASQLVFIQSGSGGGSSGLDETGFPSAFSIFFSGTYTV